jgi:hypothetical protein
MPMQRWMALCGLLRQAWPVWVGIGVPLLGWVVLPLYAPGAKPIQYFGVILETLGVLVVAYEFIEVREQLETPGMLSVVRQWFGDVNRVFSREYKPAGSTDDTSADRHVDSEPVAEHRSRADFWTIAQQIRAMVQMLDVVQQRIDTLQRLSKLEERISEERKQAAHQFTRLADQLHTVSLGNVGREFVGACLIVLGLILANLPDELYGLWRVLIG